MVASVVAVSEALEIQGQKVTRARPIKLIKEKEQVYERSTAVVIIERKI